MLWMAAYLGPPLQPRQTGQIKYYFLNPFISITPSKPLMGRGTATKRSITQCLRHKTKLLLNVAAHNVAVTKRDSYKM
jgi:hypothetical protein